MYRGGYTGKILKIDLTKQESSVERLDNSVYRKFIGGRGIGSYFMVKETVPGIGSLSPDSKICIMTGPLQGTATPYTPKFVIINKSPLSGSLSRSVCGGGEFGPAIKYAGFDGIIIEGRSQKPVYLWINNGKVEFRDATLHWGKTTSETVSGIISELGGDQSIKVMPIGPAGEKKVRFACVVIDSKAAGRGGSGAVLGSKNLKAIAVKGTGSVRVSDPKNYQEMLQKVYKAIKKDPLSEVRIKYGTVSTIPVSYKIGALPVKNYSRSRFDKINGLLPEKIKEKIFFHNESCFGCPLPCGQLSIIKSGPYKGTVLQGPQYESVGLLGSNCEIGDILSVARANYLCNEYGMDTISTGNVIAFTLECYEKDLITKEDADGMDLRFGDSEILIELIEKIAKRNGIGNLLAEGTKRVSSKIGKNSEDFAMHSKGQGFAAFEPRSVVGMGLLYATATPGANHSYGPTFRAELLDLKDPLTGNRKGQICRKTQNAYCLQDSMIFCSFSRYGLNDDSRFELFKYVTGTEISQEESEIIGDRIYTLEKIYNLREGFGARDDTLPTRSTHEAMPDGPSKGNKVPLQEMLTEYYRERGWDEKTGVPKKETLERLDLKQFYL